jgi:hypothetical protein
MACPRGKLPAIGGLVVIVIFAGPAAGQNAPAKENPELLLKQLLASFDAWDLNKDGVLDKHELARAFRGPGAKPFDDPAALAAPATVALGPVAALTLPLPMPVPPGNFPGAGLFALPGLAGNPAVQALNLADLPDYQFLKMLGKIGKTGKASKAKISKKTFATWAKKRARQLQKEFKAEVAVQKARAKVQQVQTALALAQTKVNQARTAKARQSAQKEVMRKTQELERANASLQKHLQTLARATAQLADVPVAVRRALAPRP